MTTRRSALTSILGCLASLVACARSRPLTTRSPPSRGEFDRQLLADLERTSTRAYSEEGIPMFLTGENLAGRAADSGAPQVSSTPSQIELAHTFRRSAETLARLRPESSEEDAAKLLEVLAEREFGASTCRATR